MSTGSDRLFVIRVLLIAQLVMCVVITVVAFLLGDTPADTEGFAGRVGSVEGYSAGLGGLVCLIPNAYFAIRVFQHRGARSAQKIVRSFYAGEAGKLALTAVLFAAVFVWVKPLSPGWLFAAFVLVQATGWVTPLFVRDRRR